jgi:hypothetical protein
MDAQIVPTAEVSEYLRQIWFKSDYKILNLSPKQMCEAPRPSYVCLFSIIYEAY